MARAIERLIQLDEQESAKQHERLALLALTGAVVEALPDGLVVCDLDGKIVMLNEQTEFMFGYHRSDLIGQPVEHLLPERMREQHSAHRRAYNQFNRSPHARTLGLGMQLTGLRSDGLEFPADITLARMVVPKGVYNLALIRYSPRIVDLVTEIIQPQLEQKVENHNAG